MPTKYTHATVEGDIEIYRNDEHVATFDPITEDVTYTHGNDKYSGPIGREVVKIQKGGKPKPEPKPEPKKKEEKLAPVYADPHPSKELTRLRKYVASLEEEIRQLKAAASGTPTLRVPERYIGIPKNPEGAPVRKPELGDLTPEFIEWAREGGYTKEQFLQVYKNRIKDLTYPAPKKG